MTLQPPPTTPQCIRLEPLLDLRATAPLKDALLERRGGDLLIDASTVERFGAQCAQVLLSAAKTWSSDGYTLSIINPSPAFYEGVNHLAVDLPISAPDGEE